MFSVPIQTASTIAGPGYSGARKVPTPSTVAAGPSGVQKPVADSRLSGMGIIVPGPAPKRARLDTAAPGPSATPTRPRLDIAAPGPSTAPTRPTVNTANSIGNLQIYLFIVVLSVDCMLQPTSLNAMCVTSKFHVHRIPVICVAASIKRTFAPTGLTMTSRFCVAHLKIAWFPTGSVLRIIMSLSTTSCPK